MAMEEITDHAARALSRVITALRGTEFENLVRVFTTEIQTCETALHAMFNVIRNPALAETATLDLIAKLVGAEERGALTDAQYRLRVDTAIERNRSWTEPESVIATLLAFFPDHDHVLRDADQEGARSAVIKPETFEVLDGYFYISPALAEEFMRYVARTAATRLIFHYAPFPNEEGAQVALFDTPGRGFESAFSAAVDQNTRN